ncbi:MAG: glycosyltransferase [Deltaproteobacteria bacterium]|nr:glycosyltransferase [Deltaproteobacteria bacterium]
MPNVDREYRKVSILIPVYNERYLVATLIERVLKAPIPNGYEREIIIVDDCSNDGTDKILKAFSEQNPEIRLFTQPVNKGKGASIQKAISEATGNIIIFQDSDLEYDPDEYLNLLQPILEGHADVVYGSRFLAGKSRRVLYFRHALGNRFLTFVSNLFTDLNLTDMETCYKVFRAELLKSIPIRSKRFGLEPEITAKISKRGFRIYEVPISYHGRTYQEGKKITWKDGLNALFVILRYWLIDDVYSTQHGDMLYALSGTHRFNRWMASEVSRYIGNSVIEIGSGIGNMALQLLPRDRYVCSDIDPLNLHALRSLFSNRPNVEVRYLDISTETNSFSEQDKFDTVLCLNVLEHIKNDTLALKNISELLLPKGRAIILVPNAPSLFSTLDAALNHVKRYSKNDLQDLLSNASFDIERIWFFNRISTPGWIWNGKILKRRYFSRIQLKVFDSLVWLWRCIDPYLPWPGQSLIVVGRKSSQQSSEKKFSESHIAPAI